MKIDLRHGDCLEIMKEIPDGSVDMVLCDLPYGTTHCEWDKPIPFQPLWEQYRRVCKPNAAILLFGSQPFTTDLINSNRKMFKYEIIWQKTNPAGFFDCYKRPMRNHENIAVFYSKQPQYNPIKTKLSDGEMKARGETLGYRKISDPRTRKGIYNPDAGHNYVDDGTRFPTDIVQFSNWNGVSYSNNQKAVKHPTQKPVPLLEYLIKTYTNEGALVLDNCMGGGSTGVACANTRRNFIGIELEKKYFDIAQERINAACAELGGQDGYHI